MASNSGGQISLLVREAALDPQQLYHVMVKSPYMTNNAGQVVSWHYHWFLGILHIRQLVIEGRGYYAGNLPSLTGSSSTKSWDISQNGEIVSQGTFEEKSVSTEAFRTNEAGMFRVRKTVTIKALYENGNYAAGQTDFDSGDYEI